MRIELMTSRLQGEHSTTELSPLIDVIHDIVPDISEGRNQKQTYLLCLSLDKVWL